MENNPFEFDPLDYQYKVKGSLGGGGCLSGDTLIWAVNGLISIKDIKVGDTVHCFTSDNEIVLSTVLSTSTHENYDLNRYHYWGGYVDATPNHAFYTENKAFKEIGQWEEDEFFIDSNFEYRPLLKTEYLGKYTVYNFVVKDWHTYIVGKVGILSSNGGGGKGGANRTPIEQAAGTPSNSYAQVVELISGGLCRGFRNRPRDIFLDKTPIQNNDGSFNFKDVVLDHRNGSNFQTRLPGFSNFQSSETNVGVEITSAFPTARTVRNNQIDAFIIRLGFVLQQYQDNGDITGNACRFQIFIQEGNGPFVLRQDQTISNRFPSLREFEFRHNVNNQGGNVDTFTIRVVKVTPDSDSSKNQIVFRWQSFLEIIDARLAYPNSFIVGLQFGAEQFSSAPTRAYTIGGILCRIPTNTHVASPALDGPNKGHAGGLWFDGVWDGGLYRPVEPTSDPAWIVYDVLTDEIHGLGNRIDPSKINIQDLYEISLYNNELVDDGFGMQERRFRLATYIQSKEPAFKYINAMLSSCNAHAYWDGQEIRFWQDRPGTITHIFTNSDVTEGVFTYSSTDIKSRFSVANVTWNDPDDFFRQTIEPVELDEALEIYGYRETEFAAYGCFSRSQAIRAGRYYLATNFYETETVNFTTRHMGVFCRPGDIIAVADSKRSLVEFAGLILDATTTTITLDRTIALGDGVTYSIQIKLPNGEIATRNIANDAGLTSEVTVTTPFSQVPNREANWIINIVETQLFRLLTMEATGEDLSKIEIVASQYEPQKYDFVENNLSIQPREIQAVFPNTATPPINIQTEVAEILNNDGQIVSYALKTSWKPPQGSGQFISGYLFQFKVNINGAWSNTISVFAQQYELPNAIKDQEYYIRIASQLLDGKVSPWVEFGPTLIGYNGLRTNFTDSRNSYLLASIA